MGAIVLGVVAPPGIMLPFLMQWEKRRTESHNRVEEAIAAAMRELSANSEPELRAFVLQHPYLNGVVEGSAPAAEVLNGIREVEYKRVLDTWERLSRQPVECERASGHAGKPQLIAHEAKLVAALRLLEKRRAR